MKTALNIIDSGIFEHCEIGLKVSDSDTRSYVCESCFRILPGRRLTALASCDGKKYVIKIFPRRKRSLSEFEDEKAGYELLHSASIEVPPRIYYGPAQDGVNIIVYKYISRSRTLSDVFSVKPQSRQQLAVLKRFAEQLSRLHRNGLIHEDPHLGNFLIKGDVVTVLDSGAVRRVINENLLEKNYGLFVAQFPISWQLNSEISRSYIGTKEVNAEYLERLYRHAEYFQGWREQRYLKKIYRECTAFHVHSFMSGKIIIDRDYIDSGLMSVLDEPHKIFNKQKAGLMKDGNSSTVGMIELDGIEFVVKRYNVKGKAHRIKQMLRETRASRSWRNAHRMLSRGFLTAKPVAMMECIKGRNKGVSVFVMLNVPGMHSADYFRHEEVGEAEKRKVAVKMLDIINELHHERILHGDLKSTNFIINEGMPFVIDLDAMRVVSKKCSMTAGIEKDIRRFRENWINDAEPEAIFGELMKDQTTGSD